jgi:hypothetical protein
MEIDMAFAILAVAATAALAAFAAFRSEARRLPVRIRDRRPPRG